MHQPTARYSLHQIFGGYWPQWQHRRKAVCLPCISPWLTTCMLHWQKIVTKRPGITLFEFYKWMGEECCEYTQSDPAPSELGFQCKHWPLFENPGFEHDGCSTQNIWKPLACTRVANSRLCCSRFKEIHPDEIRFKPDCQNYPIVLHICAVNPTSLHTLSVKSQTFCVCVCFCVCY